MQWVDGANYKTLERKSKTCTNSFLTKAKSHTRFCNTLQILANNFSCELATCELIAFFIVVVAVVEMVLVILMVIVAVVIRYLNRHNWNAAKKDSKTVTVQQDA